MTQVLSFYPITDSFHVALQMHLGKALTPRFLGEYRKPTLIGTWKALRTLADEPLVLALDDSGAQAPTALLLTVGALFGPRGTQAYSSDLVESRVSKVSGWMNLGSVIIDSLLARIEARKLRGFLEKARWTPFPFRGGRKIAYLKTTLGYGVKAGGSVGHVAGVVNSLKKMGNAIEVFANEAQPLVEPGTPFFQVAPPSLFAYPAELNLVRFHHATVKSVDRRFRDARPDWIYQRLSTSNFAGAILSLQHQLPLVVEYNGSEVWIAKNWGEGIPYESLSLSCEEALLRQATLVVTVSEVLGEELRGRGIPPDRIFVHPNCVDPVRYRPDLLSPSQTVALKQELGLDAGDLVITFLGTFGAWHGVDFLAETIRRLYSENPEWWDRHQVALVMVGDGVLKSKVQAELQGIPRIRFTGLVPQMSAPSYLAISDILLSPHVDRRTGERFFGSPTKLFEYMAVGKCVIASDLEQIGQVLSPGFRVGGGFNPEMVGMLFQPGDHQGFIEAIRWAVEHPSERVQLGHSARLRAVREYTWELFAERLLAKLHTLQ